jgi:NADH-quinone oxidoreductase subunit L
MEGFIWTLPALPLAGFVVLALLGPRLGRRGSGAIGAGSVGLAAAYAIALAFRFWTMPPAEGAWRQVVWTWFQVGDLSPAIGFRMDPLALIMCLVVTCVGFLIHLYSTEYMENDESVARFFAEMNLFVASMLTLVLADNLVLLYLGWEGVGLCSYLLIGFWYRDPANGHAARKAFIVTRVGDAAMALGLFLIFTQLGTLNIQDAMSRAVDAWPLGSGTAVLAAVLLLGGAVGKSAQLPLQTWLPDAMAGPTPVSALIHAATMVTAGVYLIARTHVLFMLAPVIMLAVAVIGAATLLLSGFAALAQTDIKRVLAYSTISQIGYMFLALGVGAWAAGIFHLMTHAFFKALLFLAAGAVSEAIHHERDLRKMGGLARALPLVYVTFLIGAAALSGFPLVTAGYYSKDMILHETLVSAAGSVWLYLAGLVGALLTALYAFRLIFLTFHGPVRTEPKGGPGLRMGLPLVVLAGLAVVGGAAGMPGELGGFAPLIRFLAPVFAVPRGHVELATAHGGESSLIMFLLPVLASLLGILWAWAWFLKRRPAPDPTALTPLGEPVRRLWLEGWAFDRLYDWFFVGPYEWLVRSSRGEVFDTVYRGLAGLARAAHGGLRTTQDGRLRRYAAALGVGGLLCLLAALLR